MTTPPSTDQSATHPVAADAAPPDQVPVGSREVHPVASPASPPSPARTAVAQLARGFVMGSADVVPGVSGGTVALVLGIYRQLIDALHTGSGAVRSLLRGDLRGTRERLRAVPWLWLLSLVAGIGMALFTLAGPLESALHNYPVQLAGLFVGLIAAAVVLCWRQLHRATPMAFGLAAVAAVATFLLLGLETLVDPASSPALWHVFLAGGIAICAMILPGISGSFLLVVMGMYAYVLAAVAELNVVVLAVFALGCATGLAAASSGLNWLLNRHHDLVLASMIGLMVGSIRILWPWPAGLGSTAIALPASGTALVPMVLAVVGFAVVVGVDAVARRMASDDA